jgi:PPOX class probable FMN-dependent enzyme
MAHPHWRALIQGSLHRHRTDPGARYVQLATVDPSGYPRNRTVVFRGFLDNSDLLQFAVDSRSEKLAHIQANPQAQVCWYFGKTREQFRIAGSLIPILDPQGIQGDVGEQEEHHRRDRERLWSQMSERGRLLWYWPAPKGSQAEPSAYITQLPAEAVDPPANFVLLLLDPVEVDHLQLKGDLTYPQLRQVFSRMGSQWQHRSVNP